MDDTTEEKPPEYEPGDEWETYRQLSIRPGGFRDERVTLWCKLLNVSGEGLPSEPVLKDEEGDPDTPHHPDEHQIQLDTDRSFVMYPNEEEDERRTLQSDLHTLLITLFRKRPKLSYFQGYHDIMTVLLLTLPPEVQLACAEKLSLQRLRDAMGSGLEPILGLLRFMDNLMYAADPDFAEILRGTSRLPFFALSNLLTLFSHDVPTLPLIQHIFDYLLCRPPIACVYLATVITLVRKPEVLRLQAEDEDGMIHSALSSLPNITDEEELSESETPEVKEEADTTVESSVETKKEDSEENPIIEVASEMKTSQETESTADQPSKDEDAPHSEEVSIERADSRSSSPPPSKKETPPPRLSRPSVALHWLLTEADALYARYPPDTPSLGLSGIMGPQSVIYTWSSNPSDLPSDDAAEAMVDHPKLVVYPYIEEEPVKEVDTSFSGGRSRKRPSRSLILSHRGTMVFGAVLVLGVAMAMYSSKHGALRDGRRPYFMKDLKVLAKWIGTTILGTGERLMHQEL